MYVRVCQFSGKTNSFEFSISNLPKNGFGVSNSEIYRRNKNQHPRYTMCANFQAEQTPLTFSAQICPKMDLGLATQKTIVGITISIFDIPCVPNFSQNEQLCIFRAEFVQKRI